MNVLFLVTFVLLMPLAQTLPTGPVEALKTLGAWILELGMAYLMVRFAMNAIKTGKVTQDNVAKDLEQDKPIKDRFIKWAYYALTLVMMISTFLLPPLVFGQQGPIGSVLSWLLDWIVENFFGFLG